MKYSFFIPLLVLAVVLSSGFALSSNVAHAQGASMYTPGQQYNFTFRFRNQERFIRNQTDLRLLLQDIIAYLRELQDTAQTLESEVEVSTHSAANVDNDSATLRGEVTDFNDSDYATVWFEYGRSSSALTTKTSTKRLNDSSDGEFSRNVTGLREDTKYYFRAVARDDNGRNDYGSIVSFATDETSPQDEPDVSTRSATDITDDSAILRGLVDMNDFRNGRVFFVYGEDEDRIDEVSDDYETYEDVDEHGDDLQKVLVDRDLDDSDSYEEKVTSLNDDTEHFFNLCVAYEDEDSDDVITCGSARSFTTDS